MVPTLGPTTLSHQTVRTMYVTNEEVIRLRNTLEALDVQRSRVVRRIFLNGLRRVHSLFGRIIRTYGRITDGC